MIRIKSLAKMPFFGFLTCYRQSSVIISNIVLAFSGGSFHKKYLKGRLLLHLRILLFYFALFSSNPSNYTILSRKPKAESLKLFNRTSENYYPAALNV